MYYQYLRPTKWICLFFILTLYISKTISVGVFINEENVVIKMINTVEKLVTVDRFKDSDQQISLQKSIDVSKDIVKIFEKSNNYGDSTQRLLFKIKYSKTVKINEKEVDEIKKLSELMWDIDRSFDDLFSLYLSNKTDVSFTSSSIPYFFNNEKYFKGRFDDGVRLIAKWAKNLTVHEGDTFPKNLFALTLELYKSKEKRRSDCDEPSIYYEVYQLYESILTNIGKGYTMIFMTDQFRKLIGENVYDYEIQQRALLKKLKNDIVEITDAAYSTLNQIDDSMDKKSRACDPIDWQEGVNFMRMKNHVTYFEPTVEYESNRMMKWEAGFKNPEIECDGILTYWNPDDLSKGVVYSLNCPSIFLEDYRGDANCKHWAFKTLKRSEDVAWKKSCFHGRNSWLGELCACDKQIDEGVSVRTLSLKEHYTNSSDNRVVTGVRFVVRNNVIGIQIREGKLVNGSIDPDTAKWIDDDGKSPENSPDTIHLNYSMRGFNLDDIELPHEHLVTGVKFYTSQDGRISLAVRGSAMYNDQKQTFPSIHDKWYYAQDLPNKTRENINIRYYEEPTTLLMQNDELSTPGLHYVNISQSVYSERFQGTTIIPFFDLNDVAPNPPIALGGLGILYKSQPNYGGFLAFNYITSKYNIFVDKDKIQFLNDKLSNMIHYLN